PSLPHASPSLCCPPLFPTRRSSDLLRPAVHHRGGAHPRVRRRLSLRRGDLHRPDPALRLRRPAAAHARALPGVAAPDPIAADLRSEEHTSEFQSLTNLVCRLLLEKK